MTVIGLPSTFMDRNNALEATALALNLVYREMASKTR